MGVGMLGGNILVVEDSGLSRMQLRKLLETAGYTVFEAVTGGQVLNNTFNRETKLANIDLVLLDLYLPDVEGTEVLKSIIQRHPDLPVIITSIEQRKEKIIHVLDMGARDYLVKPIDSQRLLKRVERYLAEKTKAVSQSSTQTTHWEQFRDILIAELERAVRSKSYLTLVVIAGPDSFHKKLCDTASQKLRRIDSVFLLTKSVVLVLPATNETGSDIVLEKLMPDEAGGIDRSNLLIKKVVFPRDVTAIYIEQYRIEELCDEILSQLFGSPE